MFDIQTILTAIDLDSTTGRILETASRLASYQEGSRHFLCHAVDPISSVYERILFPYACFGDDREALLADLLGRAESIIAENFRGNRDSLGSHTLRMAYGHPAAAILREADSIGPDMVVLGATTSDALGHRRLGREAGEVAARARVPVMLVRRRSGNVRFKKAAAALDFGPQSAEALAQSVAFAHVAGCTLHAVHVVPSVASLDHAGYLNPPDHASDKKLMKSVDRQFQKVASNMKLSFPIREDIEEILSKPSLAHGDPGPELVRYAEQEELDLLILPKCQSDGGSGLRLGRVAEYVARNASCDVLLLPPPKQRNSSE
jgi:nucleotide-binding universal stress UspA family protein